MGSQLKFVRRSLRTPALLLALCLGSSTVHAHDIWVETNTPIVRTGDAVDVSLLLGNHGNGHRDFKIAGKVDVEKSTLDVVQPDGTVRDIRSALEDRGYEPKLGHWATNIVTGKPGLYVIAHTSDKVVSYAPKRSVKSAKAMFIASDSLDNVPSSTTDYDRVFGHALELVPRSNPVAPMGPGVLLKVQLLYQGKPLADARVSFIPRGETLKEDFDERYERRTDAAGMVSFEPKQANLYLIVAHHEDATVQGEGYTSSKFSATLTVRVPALCPCCE